MSTADEQLVNAALNNTLMFLVYRDQMNAYVHLAVDFNEVKWSPLTLLVAEAHRRRDSELPEMSNEEYILHYIIG